RRAGADVPGGIVGQRRVGMGPKTGVEREGPRSRVERAEQGRTFVELEPGDPAIVASLHADLHRWNEAGAVRGRGDAGGRRDRIRGNDDLENKVVMVVERPARAWCR